MDSESELFHLDDSKVQEKNAVVIIAKARERLKIKKGDKVGFYEWKGHPGKIVIMRVESVASEPDDSEK